MPLFLLYKIFKYMCLKYKIRRTNFLVDWVKNYHNRLDRVVLYIIKNSYV